MKTTDHVLRWGAALVVLLAAACASTPPLQVDNLPRSNPLAPIERGEDPVIAVALGGGAARGFAHVGVLNVLDRSGIGADMVVGTSAGSLVGALYAAGLRGQRLEREALRLETERLTDYIFPNRGFIRGERLQQYVNEAVGDLALENMPIPFAVAATDLYSGALVVFNAGNTGMAVRASSSVPGIVQPVSIGGREYVDGGLVSQVPVRVARDWGADVVIAVDISRLPTDSGQIETTLDMLHQAMLIMSIALVEEEVDEADVLIRPTVGGISLTDFNAREEAIAAGERAAQAKLPAIREAIEKAAARRSTE